MDSLEVEYLAADEINENSEYDALNDETFGTSEDIVDDDWEQEHEKFAIIEENFRKFTTAPVEHIIPLGNSEKPCKYKSLEEIERELMQKTALNISSAAQQLNENTRIAPIPVQEQVLQNPPQTLPNNEVEVSAQLTHITPVTQPARINRLLLPWQKQGQFENAQTPVQIAAQQYVTILQPTSENVQPAISIQGQAFPSAVQPQLIFPANQMQVRPVSQPIHLIVQSAQSLPQEFLPVTQGKIPLAPGNIPVAQTNNPLNQGNVSGTQGNITVVQGMSMSHSRPNHSHQLSESELDDEEYDPYAGLMNQRERRWLANIQVMQLEGDDPDYDFYFIEYQKRHGLQHRNSNNDKYNGLHNTEPLKNSYVPLQFENSLGKVQVGSVQAPRKVMDREIFSNGSKSPVGADAKRKPRKKLKHILLELEYMYAALQRLDNLNGACNQQRRPPQPPPLEVGTSTIVKDYPTDPAVLMSSFLKDRDHFLAYMSIRKGKVLGYRLLRLQQNDRFWLMLFQDFVLLVTRDRPEETLLTYLPVLRSWLVARGSWEMLCCLLPLLMEDATDFSLTNKFGMSVIASLIRTAESLYNADCPCLKEHHELYVQFMMTLVDKATLHKAELQRPVMGLDMKTLESNFYRIESHFFRLHQRVDASKKAVLVHALALPTYQKKKNKMKH